MKINNWLNNWLNNYGGKLKRKLYNHYIRTNLDI